MKSNPAAFLSIAGSTPIYVGDPDFTQAVKSHFSAASPASMFKIVGCDRIAFAAFDDANRNRLEVKITGKATGASQPWLTTDGRAGSFTAHKASPAVRFTGRQLPPNGQGSCCARPQAGPNASLGMSDRGRLI